jgi:hypothetical protein
MRLWLPSGIEPIGSECVRHIKSVSIENGSKLSRIGFLAFSNSDLEFFLPQLKHWLLDAF